MTWMRTSNGQGRQAPRFSKSPKIRRTVRAATAPKIPKGTSGILQRTFLNVRNQEGSEEILRNCDETWRGTILDLSVSPIASVLDPERKVQRSHSGSSMTLIQRREHELEHEPRENRRIPVPAPRSRRSIAPHLYSQQAVRAWERGRDGRQHHRSPTALPSRHRHRSILRDRLDLGRAGTLPVA